MLSNLSEKTRAVLHHCRRPTAGQLLLQMHVNDGECTGSYRTPRQMGSSAKVEQNVGQVSAVADEPARRAASRHRAVDN